MIKANVHYGDKFAPDAWTADEWKAKSDPWEVTLHNGRRRLSVPFFTGEGLRQSSPNGPSAADVLECLISEASSGAEDFAEFCSNFGYDEDSRSAEKAWRECVKMRAKLQKFLNGSFEEAERGGEEWVVANASKQSGGDFD